jgi:hypothetical protein
MEMLNTDLSRKMPELTVQVPSQREAVSPNGRNNLIGT